MLTNAFNLKFRVHVDEIFKVSTTNYGGPTQS